MHIFTLIQNGFMYKITFILLLTTLCCSCTPDHEKPAHEEGEHIYITDSLASQVNTPIPDSNKKQADTAR